MIFFPKKEPAKSEASRSDLESAITDAVKNSDPACAKFVGVIIQRELPKSRFDANWAIRGVKFGTADRGKSLKAIATIVERMQRDFSLSNDERAKKGDGSKSSARKIAD
jgi:hypothetical protein